jgi:hypothetical protein
MQLIDSVRGWLSDIQIGRRPRSGPRVVLDEQVLLRVPFDEEYRPVLLRDLSAGGACVRTDLQLTRGDVVMLVVDLGAGAQFEFGAKVISVRNNDHNCFREYGLRIVEVTMENAALLNAYVDRHLADA